MTTRMRSIGALASLGGWAAYIGARTAARRGTPVRPIPHSPLPRRAPLAPDTHTQHGPASARPIPHVAVPQHPYMAANPGSNMHCDAYISDTYEASGPLGAGTEVISRTEGFGGYGTFCFDSHGRLVGVYHNGRQFRLELMDPDTLELLASYDLPGRHWSFFFRGVRPWEYLGAGMYFYLDHQDRAVVPTTRNTVQVVQVPDLKTSREFDLVREYDLGAYMVPNADDSPAFVLPDWEGSHYWFASVEGVVGTIEIATGSVHNMRLEGELVENSFAVGEEGAFIISDQAMYRFVLDDNGAPEIAWRTEYSKAETAKAGHISVGSGSSTTLTGTPADGLIVVTDNADPRINLLFISRHDGKLVGSAPLFGAGQSGTDLTAIGFEHATDDADGTGHFSAIVENNWGPHTFPVSRCVTPGLTRVDAVRQDDGSFSIKEVWSTDEKSIGGFRLSLGNGLVYIYDRDGDSWYLTGINFETGTTAFKHRVGTGMGFNNWQGSLFLHPDGRSAISTTIFGLVMIRDRA